MIFIFKLYIKNLYRDTSFVMSGVAAQVTPVFLLFQCILWRFVAGISVHDV